MNKENKLSSIMLISFLVVIIVAGVVNLLYLIYFATMLIVNKIKTK